MRSVKYLLHAFAVCLKCSPARLGFLLVGNVTSFVRIGSDSSSEAHTRIAIIIKGNINSSCSGFTYYRPSFHNSLAHLNMFLFSHSPEKASASSLVSALASKGADSI